MKKLFSMDMYFNSDYYKIIYFDYLIKLSGYTKEAILSELDIPYMSYSRAKDNSTKGSRIVVDKLNKYFSINDVDSSKKKEYEEILNSIIYKFYYRNSNLLEFESILIDYINENNYLNPLFRLLLFLVRTIKEQSPKKFIDENIDEYSYLLQFKKNYFISPFYELFTIIEILYSDVILYEYDKDYSFSENMQGLIYYAYTSNAYLSNKYDLCLYYARECKDYLLKDCNYERILAIDLTYFACLNMIGEYKKCMRESYFQLLHLIETDKAPDMIRSTKIQYLVACLGAKEYKEVIDSIENFNTFSSTEYDYLFCASYAYDRKLFNNYLEKFENEKNRFSNIDLEYNYLTIDYITRKNKGNLKNEILEKKYNIGFKSVLLKFF